jgi:hypothetical protein
VELPPLILPSEDALDERLDGGIGPQIGVGVATVGSLHRPERRQRREVAHHRPFANDLRGLVVRLFRRLLPLPAAALSIDDLGAEKGHQLFSGNKITVVELPGVLRPGLLPVSVCCLNRPISFFWRLEKIILKTRPACPR